jgi:uncharacterized OB-fold protein
VTEELLPLPDVSSGLAAPFWQAAREGRLVFQRCGTCGYRRWPPAPVCPECLTPGGSWTEVDGHGTIWSFAIYEHAYHPAFRGQLPYNVALVELEAGPRLITNIVGIAPEALCIGLRVEPIFEAITADVTLVRFRPAD